MSRRARMEEQDAALFERLVQVVDDLRDQVVIAYAPKPPALLTTNQRRGMLALIRDLEGLMMGFPDAEAAVD